MITQVTSMFFFSEKWTDNEVDSQNVGGNQKIENYYKR